MTQKIKPIPDGYLGAKLESPFRPCLVDYRPQGRRQPR